jgi:hypothetical protein
MTLSSYTLILRFPEEYHLLNPAAKHVGLGFWLREMSRHIAARRCSLRRNGH